MQEESSLLFYFREKEIEIAFNEHTKWEFISDTFLKIIEKWTDEGKIKTCTYYFRMASIDSIAEA